LSYEALLAQGFDLTGSAGNDTIAGTNVNDRITGDTGDDTLMGGAGDDRYRFALGDGQDRIIDTAGADTVAFGPGLNVADLTAAQRTDAEGRWLDLGFAGGANAKLSFLKSRRWRYGDSQRQQRTTTPPGGRAA
jgi:Ca2+-binding RTX toxin-like protein